MWRASALLTHCCFMMSLESISDYLKYSTAVIALLRVMTTLTQKAVRGLAGVDRGNKEAHLVEEALVVESLSLRPHIGLAQRNLLTDVTLAIAGELGLFVPMSILGLKPPLTFPFSPPLFPAGPILWVRADQSPQA